MSLPFGPQRLRNLRSLWLGSLIAIAYILAGAAPSQAVDFGTPQLCPDGFLNQILSMPGVPPADHQERLIVSYATGHCRPANGLETERKLREAANKNHRVALFVLGLSYEAGIGAMPDRQRAKSFYQRAAQHGSTRAMHQLGLDRLRQANDEPGRKAGIAWLAKAAQQGRSVSALLLGQIYETGRYGVTRDACKARVWFKRAGSSATAAAGIRSAGAAQTKNCDLQVAGSGYPKTQSTR